MIVCPTSNVKQMFEMYVWRTKFKYLDLFFLTQLELFLVDFEVSINPILY